MSAKINPPIAPPYSFNLSKSHDGTQQYQRKKTLSSVVDPQTKQFRKLRKQLGEMARLIAELKTILSLQEGTD